MLHWYIIAVRVNGQMGDLHIPALTQELALMQVPENMEVVEVGEVFNPNRMRELISRYERKFLEARLNGASRNDLREMKVMLQEMERAWQQAIYLGWSNYIWR